MEMELWTVLAKATSNEELMAAVHATGERAKALFDQATELDKI